MTRNERREMAYWLTLAFRLEREPRRAINGLVLTADRKLGLGLVDLVRMDAATRPAEVAKYSGTLDRLLDAEGKVSAQAFVVERLLSMGGGLVPITDPAYPPHVARRIGVDRAPTLLSFVGDPSAWKVPGIAISGSRKSGPTGLAFAREAGRAVARAGDVVVCGLAAGVDREALEGALEAGGRVLGIAPEGIVQSRWLRRPEIREGRLTIVSEFAPEDRWSAGRAMARNRTIAGFSGALVIADCVASGGTTDQLEVHRSAGLVVFVRRGRGEGALVDELCRRAGVTPWYWNSGPLTWPPAVTELANASAVDCVVTTSCDRVQIHVDAPRQLTLDAVLDAIRTEYDRATAEPAEDTYATGEASRGVVSEEEAGYERAPDAVIVALGRAGSKGATVRDIETATGLTTYRVRKRLAELVDAHLAKKAGRRYYDTNVDIGERQTARRLRSSEPPAESPTLFADADLRSRRSRS